MKLPYAFGLIGHNIAYSRSPDVFAEIFRQDEVAGRFDLFDIAPERFDAELEHVLTRGVQGLSVTIPHKQRIIDRVTDVDHVAGALGAVNSVAVDGAVLHGYNTDPHGFVVGLGPHAGYCRNGTALILGSGGAAKAAVFGLYDECGVRRFTVVGRSRAKLAEFTDTMTTQLPEAELNSVLFSELDNLPGRRFTLMVNATPLGGWNHLEESPVPDGFDWSSAGLYYDLNYNRNNPVVQAARRAGVTAIDGAAMLVGQAVRSYHLWTGRTVQFEPVFKAAFGK